MKWLILLPRFSFFFVLSWAFAASSILFSCMFQSGQYIKTRKTCSIIYSWKRTFCIVYFLAHGVHIGVIQFAIEHALPFHYIKCGENILVLCYGKSMHTVPCLEMRPSVLFQPQWKCRTKLVQHKIPSRKPECENLSNKFSRWMQNTPKNCQTAVLLTREPMMDNT